MWKLITNPDTIKVQFVFVPWLGDRINFREYSCQIPFYNPKKLERNSELLGDEFFNDTNHLKRFIYLFLLIFN